MLTLFSKAPPTPPPENADVIPCTGIDLAARRMVVTTGLIVDCKLDPNKLQTTLASLVEHKFPRAGARLAFRNQVWEFHVPHQFDETTPPIAFTSHDYAELYASSSRPHIEHIRRSSSLEPFVCDLPILDSFLRSPNCPKTTDGYLAPNTPLLQVHVSTFDDLTFLGVTSTHILLDAVGTGQLLRAWTRLLDGEALEDIPGMPRDLQPFEPLTLTTTNETNIPHMRGWYKLGLFSTCLFLVNFLWRLWREPKEEVKLVRVPKIFLERMKKEILDQLAAHASEEWVGSSDVMLAWWYKTSYNHRFDLTRLHVHLPVNLRDISFFSSPEFGDELKSLSTPYINNAVASIAVPPLPISVLRRSPISHTALHFRRAILAYHADTSGIAADIRWRCSYPLRALMPCPPGAEYAIQSSWRMARLSELDWTGAKAAKDKHKASVVAVIPMMTSNKQRPLRGSGAILMEDEKAIWMSQVWSSSDWEALRRTGGVRFLDAERWFL